MSKKVFETGIVITGDETGAVRALRATDKEIGKFSARSDKARAAQDRLRLAIAAGEAAQYRAATAVRDVTARLQAQSDAVDANVAGIRTWAGVIAGVGVAGMAALAVSQADVTKKIVVMADALGMSSSRLAEFAYVAADQGVALDAALGLAKDTAEKIGEAMQMDSGEAVDALKELGFSAANLVEKSPVDMILNIGDAMGRLESEAAKSAILEMFGNDLTLLIPKLRDGAAGYNEMAKQGRDLGVVMSDIDMQRIADMSDGVGKLGDAGLGEFNQVLAGIAPAIDATATIVADNIGVVTGSVALLAGVTSGHLVNSMAKGTAAMFAAEAATQKKALADLSAAGTAKELAVVQARVAVSEQAAAQRALANAGAMGKSAAAMAARSKAGTALAIANQKVIATELALTTATKNLTVAQAAASRGARLFATAWGVLGGPVGLLVTAGLLAATFAMSDQGDAADGLAGKTDLLTASIEGLTAAQMAQRLQQMEEPYAAAQVEARKYAAQVETLTKNLNEFPGSKKADQWRKSLVDSSGSLDTAKQKVAEFNVLQEKLNVLLGKSAKTKSDDNGQTDEQAKAIDKYIAAMDKKTAALEDGEAAQLKALLADNKALPGQKKLAEQALKNYQAEKKRVTEKKAEVALNAQLEKQFDGMIQGYEAEQKALKEGAREALKYNLIKAKYSAEQVAELMAKYDETERIRKETEATKEATKAEEARRAQFADLMQGYAQQVIALKEGEEAAYRYELRMEGFNQGQRNALVAARNHTEGLKAKKKAEEEAADAADKAAKKAAENAVTIGSLAEAAAERVDASFADAWLNIDEGFDGLVDGIQSAFTEMLAEMAHEAITKPILLNIQSGMGDMASGMFSNVAGAAASGASTAAGGAGAAAGGASAAAGGLGSAAGAVAAVPVAGWIAAAALVTVAAINKHNADDAARMLKYTAEYRQQNQSTGTVLGDLSAKSHSISNLTERLTELGGDALSVNHGQLQALQRIEVGLTGVSTGIARQLSMSGGLEDYKGSTSTLSSELLTGHFSTGFASGLIDSLSISGPVVNALGGMVDSVIGEVTSFVYSRRRRLQDAGISFAHQSLGAIIDSGILAADAYQRIRTTTSTFGFNSSSSSTKLHDLDDALQYQLADIFGNAAGLLVGFGDELDLVVQGQLSALTPDGSWFASLSEISQDVKIGLDDYVRHLEIDPQQLSLKGLRGEELTAEIESYLSSTMDTWAQQLLGDTGMSDWIEGYQQAGEGVFETLARITAESQNWQAQASKMNLQFSASGIAAADLTQQLADMAGGFDQLTADSNAYYQAFFSESEKFEYFTGQLSSAMDAAGFSLVNSREEFRALVEGLDLTTEAGQASYASLISLAPAMDQYLTQVEKEADARATANAKLAESYLSLVEQIDAAARPNGAAVNTLQRANDAMVALGMTGLTYQEALTQLDDYDASQLKGLAAALGLTFEEIQEVIADIINGNNELTGGPSASGSVMSVDAAETALSKAEEFVWGFADVINESFGGVIPTLDEFSAIFGDLGASELTAIHNKFGGLIDKMGGLPNSINGLEAAYFSQFDHLSLVDPVDEIGDQIQGVYESFLGRLPDTDGLAHWRSMMERDVDPWSIEDVEGWFSANSTEAVDYSNFLGLKDAFSAYQDILAGAGFDVGAMQTALAQYESAQGNYDAALMAGTDSAAATVNNAAAAFNAKIQGQLDGFGLEGQELDLFNLDAEFDVLRIEAESVGGDLVAVEELYGKKRTAIITEYAQDATAALAAELQKTIDFDAGVQLDLDKFGLGGQDLALFELDQERDARLKEAEKVGGDIAKVEELYGKKRTAIVTEYAAEAAQGTLEDSGLTDYMQSVYDHVSAEKDAIVESYQQQIAMIEQWGEVALGLRDYVEQIRVGDLSTHTPAEKLQMTRDRLAELMVSAENGDIDAAGKLQSAASDYLKNADSYYGRSAAYSAVFDDVTSGLDQLGIDILAANDESALERINADMEDELETLNRYAEKELAWAEAQSLSLTGISGLLSEWPDKFDTMLDGLAADIGATVANAIPDRPVITAGGAGSGGSAGGADAGGSVGGSDAGNGSAGSSGGMTDAQATAIIQSSGGSSGTNSAGYQAAVATLGITNYAQLAAVIDGSHANGLDRVPFDGYRAELHKNEMVLTADVSDHIRQSMRVSSSVQSDPAVSRVVEQLVRSNDQLIESNRQMAMELSELKQEQKRANKAAENQRNNQQDALKSVGRVMRPRTGVV